MKFSNKNILEDFPSWSVFKDSKVGLEKNLWCIAIIALYTSKQENISYVD